MKGENGYKTMYSVSGCRIETLHVIKETEYKVQLEGGRYINKKTVFDKIYDNRDEAIDAAYQNGLRNVKAAEDVLAYRKEELKKLVHDYDLKGVSV